MEIKTRDWVYEVRRDFPILERKINNHPLVYLDNAATTQKPTCVIEAIEKFYKSYNANIHRSVYTLGVEASEEYERAHKRVQKFINARKWREIVFTKNATEALNLVAYAYGLKKLTPQDNIVTTVMEHHSNFVPWLVISQWTGVQLRVCDVTDDGRLKLEELEKLVDERTKLVAVTYVSNALGVINPIKEIVEIAHSRGAIVVVDGAQAVPHLKIDVQSLDVDFLAASGHKMLGPTGTGFLYGKEKLLEELEPFLYGGEMISEVYIDRARWNELPWKFEAGTSNIEGGIALNYAIDYLEKVGMENLEAYERDLTSYTLELLKSIENIKIYGPSNTNDKLGVFSFNIEGIHPHDIASFLDNHGICVRSGHFCAQPLMRRLGMEGAVRISLYFYNTFEEIEYTVEVLKKIQKYFL